MEQLNTLYLARTHYDPKFDLTYSGLIDYAIAKHALESAAALHVSHQQPEVTIAQNYKETDRNHIN